MPASEVLRRVPLFSELSPADFQRVMEVARERSYPKNHTHIQQAMQIFGGVYLGFQVQQNCIQEFDKHQPWTPGPLTQDGHAVFAVGYDPNAVTVLTWGNTQQGTWAWWDECVDEAYAILPPEASNASFAPGFNLAQLQTDLGDVAS